MRTVWPVIIGISLLPLVASSERQQAQAGSFATSSSNLEYVEKDAEGREVRREVRHYTSDGFLSGTTFWTNTFVDGRPTHTLRVTENPNGEETGRMSERRSYDKTGLVRIVREWRNGHGELTRHETSVYSRDSKANTTLITTTARTGTLALIETRYTVLTNIRNVFHSADTSVFNADNVQTSRHLQEWRGLTVERWNFDSEDEITRYEVETLEKNKRGQVIASATDIFGSGRERIGARDRRMSYDGPHDALSLSVTTWYDGDEQALQRETVHHLHKRGTITRRVRFERWVDSLP